MIFENPPSRLRERREEHQASDTTTTARLLLHCGVTWQTPQTARLRGR
jgi:hypothetical protein